MVEVVLVIVFVVVIVVVRMTVAEEASHALASVDFTFGSAEMLRPLRVFTLNAVVGGDEVGSMSRGRGLP